MLMPYSVGIPGAKAFHDHIDGKITTITVNFSDQGIHGIGFTYLLQNGTRVQQRYNLSSSKFAKLFQQELDFEVPGDDMLAEIRGRCAPDGITQLIFRTYMGINRYFGPSNKGEPFSMHAPGCTFGFPYGSYNPKGLLTSLGMQPIILPDWVMQRLKDQNEAQAQKTKIPF